MLAMLRRIWLHLVNVGSMAWASVHCYVTAFGTPEQRAVAASFGIVGAMIILVVLNLSVRRDAELETLRAVLADVSDPAASQDIPAHAPATQDRPIA